MTDDYWNIYYVTTQLLPLIAIAVFVPTALLGLFYRGLKNL